MQQEILLRQIMESKSEREKLQSAYENLQTMGGGEKDILNAMNHRIQELERRENKLKELVGPVTSLPTEADTIFEKEFLYE